MGPQARRRSRSDAKRLSSRQRRPNSHARLCLCNLFRVKSGVRASSHLHHQLLHLLKGIHLFSVSCVHSSTVFPTTTTLTSLPPTQTRTVSTYVATMGSPSSSPLPLSLSKCGCFSELGAGSAALFMSRRSLAAWSTNRGQSSTPRIWRPQAPAFYRFSLTWTYCSCS